MTITIILLTILLGISIVLNILQRKKPLKKEISNNIAPPVAVPPVTKIVPIFSIIYNKEAIDDEDIPTIAEFVVNFNNLSTLGKKEKVENVSLGGKLSLDKINLKPLINLL